MRDLDPNEHDLVGAWVSGPGESMRSDPTEERITWLIEHRLEQLSTSSDGWETLYRDPADGRLWRRTYPQSEGHGGGSQRLTHVTCPAVASVDRDLPVEIHAADLHWITDDSSVDLCAHGTVRLLYRGHELISVPNLTLSTGALHLLRTVDIEHTGTEPVGSHLIPCCGHAMAVDRGSVVNLGCPNGLNWWVRHVAGDVEIDLNGKIVRVTRQAYAKAVLSFSQTVRSFYRTSGPKRPNDEDLEWWPTFQLEWDRREAEAMRVASVGSARSQL